MSGVTIAATLAGLARLRSSWRQRDQVEHLRQIIDGSHKGMLEAAARFPIDTGLLRKMFNDAARQLEEVLDHGTPDLHYKRHVAIRQANAVLRQRFASAGKLDFETQSPRIAEYEEEFFARFERLDWLGLHLAANRKSTRDADE